MKNLIFACALAGLFACGGSGSQSTQTEQPPVESVEVVETPADTTATPEADTTAVEESEEVDND